MTSVIPGPAVGTRLAWEAHLGENDGTMESLLHSLDPGQHGLRRKIIRERIVFLKADIIERVPELDVFKLAPKVSCINYGSGIPLARLGNHLAPFGIVLRKMLEFSAHAEKIGVDSRGKLGIVFNEQAVLLEPVAPVLNVAELNVVGQPDGGLQKHSHPARMSHSRQLFNSEIVLPTPGARADAHAR